MNSIPTILTESGPSDDWFEGYNDGYNDFARKNVCNNDYERGYSRGFSDAVCDCRIVIKAKTVMAEDDVLCPRPTSH